jgi:hypothetical protein
LTTPLATLGKRYTCDALLKKCSSLKQRGPRQIFGQVAGHQVNPKRNLGWLSTIAGRGRFYTLENL